jgi:hypothetical protein
MPDTTPLQVLDAVVDRRALRTVRSVSQVLARRIHQHLAEHPAAPTSDRAALWRELARTLKAAENYGLPADHLLTRALADATLDRRPADLPALTVAVRTVAATAHSAGTGLPPWLRRTPEDLVDPDWRPYLDQRTDLIEQRVTDLAEQTAAARPAWTRQLGDEPEDPAARAIWLRQLGVIAAYRDHYQVQDDDPTHPLGPYVETGRAGHAAYWHAAGAALAMHGIAPHDDPTLGAVAVDLYRALPPEQQADIAERLVERLGPHWYGDRHQPANDADQPAYRTQLTALLASDGALSDVVEPGTTITGQPQPDQASNGRPTRRRPPAGQRPTSARRPTPLSEQPPSPATRPRPQPTQRPPQPPPEPGRGPRPGP